MIVKPVTMLFLNNFAVNILFLLLTIVNICLFIYIKFKKIGDILLLPLVFFNYFLSVTLTNILYIFGYVTQIKGMVFYMIYQLNVIFCSMLILLNNKKFKKWLDELSFERIKNWLGGKNENN